MFTPKQCEILEQLPPVATPAQLLTQNQPSRLVCGVCRKRELEEPQVGRYHSGVCEVRDVICAECRRLAGPACLVVCVTCQAVVSRIPAHVDRTGFAFKPNSFVHVPACPNCQPDIQSSTVIEKKLFDQCRAR